MNILFLKQISIFSILVGIITGLITLIPFIGNIVFILFSSFFLSVFLSLILMETITLQILKESGMHLMKMLRLL